MAAPVHVGVDLAWGQRNRTGVAAVDAAGALVASATLRTDDEIVAWIAEHAPHPGVVAFDAPLVVANPAGSRPCERQIHAAFGRFDAGAYPSNTANPHFDPPRAHILARRLDLRIDPDGASRDREAIEVYPHPAMVGLFRLGRTLKYKRKRQGFDVQLAETLRLLALMEGLAPLRLAEREGWRAIRGVVESATTAGALRRVEDEIDGILCSHLAWLWARDGDALVVYGDAATGFIVAPPAPSHAPTPRAQSDGAIARPVPMATIPAAAASTPRPETRRARSRAGEDRRMPRPSARTTRSAADVAHTWDRLRLLLELLPEGRWTTYGDVAAALDHFPQPVSQRIAKVRPGSYWRVIRVDGTVSPEFTWDGGQKDATRPVLAALQREGVPLVDGRADPRRRLTVDDLRALLDPHAR